MKKLVNIILREFKLFFNNKVLFALFLGAPLMYGVLIGSVYKKGKITSLPVIVVDEDHTPMSQKLIDMMQESESINIISILPDMFNTKEIALKNDVTTIVNIPRNFSADVQQGRTPEFTLFVDASNTLTSNTAMMAVNTAAATLKAGIQIEALKKKGVPDAIASKQYEPFKTTIIKENIRSNNYLYFMLPGILFAVFQQVLLLGLALSFASEYEAGTFKSLARQMPSAAGLLFAKLTPYLLMSVLIMFMYYIFGLIYDFPLSGHGFEFLLATFLMIIAASGMGILVSVVIPNQLKATEILMVIATPSFILSGFTWPLSQMPHWVQSISNAIPLTHYLKIFRVLFIQHGDAAIVTPSMWNLVIIALICIIASWIVLKVKIKYTLKSKK